LTARSAIDVHTGGDKRTLTRGCSLLFMLILFPGTGRRGPGPDPRAYPRADPGSNPGANPGTGTWKIVVFVCADLAGRFQKRISQPPRSLSRFAPANSS